VQSLVEAPGTAPGSERFITMAFYHHSRPLLGGTPDIGLPSHERKGQSDSLKIVVFAPRNS
jgi:hypothetical protein